MDAKDELIKAQKDYIDFIGRLYDHAFKSAYVHGYQADNQDIITGIKMRDKIKDCESKIKNN